MRAKFGRGPTVVSKKGSLKFISRYYILYIFYIIQFLHADRRQHIINSFTSAPPNATKIAVKKVSDVDVCMFGPEL